MTITYDALDLSVHPHPGSPPPDIGHGTRWPQPPLVLTSGGHRSNYGWQAGGTHPTQLLSHFNIKFNAFKYYFITKQRVSLHLSNSMLGFIPMHKNIAIRDTYHCENLTDCF